jgi:hypothetical protein
MRHCTARSTVRRHKYNEQHAAPCSIPARPERSEFAPRMTSPAGTRVLVVMRDTRRFEMLRTVLHAPLHRLLDGKAGLHASACSKLY